MSVKEEKISRSGNSSRSSVHTKVLVSFVMCVVYHRSDDLRKNKLFNVEGSGRFEAAV